MMKLDGLDQSKSLMNKSQIIKVLKDLRINQCRCIGKCECEFGGRDIYSSYYWGKQKGAAELQICIDLLSKMKETEIRKILKR